MSRHAPRRAFLPLALLIALTVGVVSAPPARAFVLFDLIVNSLADNAANDGACTLREAITAANTDTKSGAAAGECSPLTGANTILFTVSGTIQLGSALPAATSKFTVNGGDAITIQGSGTDRIVGSNSNADMTWAHIAMKNGGNTATPSDGGSILSYGKLTLDHVSITASQGRLGGAVFVGSGAGMLTMVDSTISLSSASQSGGAVYADTGAPASIVRSTLDANYSSLYGGAVFVMSSLTLANSTLWGNESNDGGAIAGPTDISITSSTITHNTSNTVGAIHGPDSAILTIRNSIVAGNTGGDVGTPIDANTNSYIGGATATLLDPAGLADNGGPTKTVRVLKTATSLIGKGQAALCAALPVGGVDQRGFARLAASCDIGAYQRDITAPVAKAPVATLRTSVSLSGTSPRAQITWSATDNAPFAPATYRLARRIDGKAWTTISTTLTSPSATTSLSPGHTYQFRVAAVDHDGNLSAWATGPTLAPKLVQQNGSGVTASSGWSTTSSSSLSGGSAKWSKKTSASLTATVTGRAVALIATTGPGRGVAKIYVDGTLKASVDLLSATTVYRVQVWSTKFSSSATHKIKVVVAGTSGRPRVDVDAFAVVK